jgi:hypothetical protein
VCIAWHPLACCKWGPCWHPAGLGLTLMANVTLLHQQQQQQQQQEKQDKCA